MIDCPKCNSVDIAHGVKHEYPDDDTMVQYGTVECAICGFSEALLLSEVSPRICPPFTVDVFGSAQLMPVMQLPAYNSLQSALVGMAELAKLMQVDTYLRLGDCFTRPVTRVARVSDEDGPVLGFELSAGEYKWMPVDYHSFVALGADS